MPKVQYALLCDHVRVEGRGVGHVIAAGVDTVYAAQVPAGHNLGLFARITYTRNECGRPHQIEIIFQDEDGERLMQITTTSTPEWDPDVPPGWPTGMLVGLNFGVPLPRHGLYSFEILIDDQSKASLSLRVVAPPGEPPPT